MGDFCMLLYPEVKPGLSSLGISGYGLEYVHLAAFQRTNIIKKEYRRQRSPRAGSEHYAC